MAAYFLILALKASELLLSIRCFSILSCAPLSCYLFPSNPSFKAMMWYGRLAFLLKGCNGDDALIRGEDANISTIQAALISSELPEVKAGVKTTQDICKRIYAVTAFFVGKVDDSTSHEYSNALNNVFEAGFNASELSAAAKLLVSCQRCNVVRNIKYVLHNQPWRIEYEEIYRDTCQRGARIS